MRNPLIVLLLAVLTVGCQRAGGPSSWPAGDPPTEDPTADCKALADANNEFALTLYAELAKTEGNLFFSPGSIHAALSMTYAGARTQTAEQMAATLALPVEDWSGDRVASAYREMLLRLKPGPKARYSLHVANALWGQKGASWLPDFLSLTEKNYGAGLRDVDFTGRSRTSSRPERSVPRLAWSSPTPSTSKASGPAASRHETPKMSPSTSLLSTRSGFP